MEHGTCLIRVTTKDQTERERGLLGFQWGQKTLGDLAPVNISTLMEAKYS